MKREAYRHPKMLDLAARLDIELSFAAGIVGSMHEFAADYAPQGDVGKHSNGVIARACDWRRNPDDLIDALVGAGWLDKCAQRRLVVHDLHDHAPQWWKERMKKLGLDFAKAVTESTRKRQRKKRQDVTTEAQGMAEPTPEHRAQGGSASVSGEAQPHATNPSKPQETYNPSPSQETTANPREEKQPASPVASPDKTIVVRKPREPNPLFDAIAEVTASDPKASGSHIAKVAKSLREAEPPYTPDEVRRWASQAKPWGGERFPSLPQIEKEIGRIRAGPSPTSRTARGLGGIAASLQAKAQGGKLNLDRTEDRHGD